MTRAASGGRPRSGGRWAQLGAMASGAVIAIFAYEAGRARADGVPQAEPLVYSGYLTDDQGTPVADGDRPMAVELFDAEAGGNSLCRTPQDEGATEPHPVKGGHFSISLADACAAAVHANSEVWVEVEIGGTKMPRAKISAVPYALEADTASRARGLLPEGVPVVQQGLRDLECPAGFVRSPDDKVHVVCERKAGADVLDQVVLVGRGATSFWIDRHEASVWDSPDTAGQSYDGDYPASFPHNGQIAKADALLYARSVPGVPPSASLTWFQANIACRASGKRLPTAAEWQLAAAGTGDPTGLPDPDCNAGTGVKRPTDGGPGCVSVWGAEDMIGNEAEMLLDWQIGPNVAGSPATKNLAWGPEYGSSAVYGIASYAVNENSMLKLGLPAVEVRGGSFGVAFGASLFHISVNCSPAYLDPEIGFRCVIPR